MAMSHGIQMAFPHSFSDGQAPVGLFSFIIIYSQMAFSLLFSNDLLSFILKWPFLIHSHPFSDGQPPAGQALSTTPAAAAPTKPEPTVVTTKVRQLGLQVCMCVA